MIDVLLIYEHKVREIESVLVLKMLLEKKGIKTEILWIRDYARLRYFTYKKPKMIVTPYLYTNKEIYDSIISICGNVKKVLNLQWEQVFNGKSIDTTSNPKELAKYAAHICWGDSSYSRLKSTNTKYLFLTGAPQLDFLKPAFDDYFYTREELADKYCLNKNKKWVLFISSFSYYALSDVEIDEIQPLVDFDAYYFRTLTIKSKDKIVEWFKLFLKENTDYQVIYRPHPAESKDVNLNTLMKKNNNFKIITDESVKQWIKVSDIILNWYSTSGVEAYFAGKTNYFLRPYNLPDNLEYQMYSTVPKITDYVDMVNKIKKETNNKGEVSKEVIEEINKFYKYDSEYACVNIVDKIMDMLETNKYDIEKCLCSKSTVFIVILRNVLKNAIIKYGQKKEGKGKLLSRNIKKIVASQQAHMKDYISENEIKCIQDRMKKCVERLCDEK